MEYVFTRPTSPSFTQKGLKGYHFKGRNKDVQVYYVDVEKGHDTFIISKKITHSYYIIEGRGYFTIAGQRYDVEPGVFVEVPPSVEYSFSGNMKLILIMNPPWFKGNEEVTKQNPAVFSAQVP